MVATTYCFNEESGDAFKRGVAHQMSVGVVDRFEVVDVDNEQGRRVQSPPNVVANSF
jgi:hypothetical protein